MPTLALCIIARDEEVGLPLALASAAGRVDEVLVDVDARTTDRTREVAREAAPNARIEDVAFEGFAQMRNAAIGLATADWILMLDADELLEGNPRPLLDRRAIWEFPRRHWADLGRTVPSPDDRFYPDRQGRLFPRDGGVRFEMPVHEVPRGLRERERPIARRGREEATGVSVGARLRGGGQGTGRGPDPGGGRNGETGAARRRGTRSPERPTSRPRPSRG